MINRFLLALTIISATLIPISVQGQQVHLIDSITGTVRYCRGNLPVYDATVLVVGTTRGSTTDSTGRFVIKNVPTGFYAIRIASTYYGFAAETTITLESHPSHELNLSLCPDRLECEMDSVKAKFDLLAGSPRLFVNGPGLVSILLSEDDREFEEHYGIKYLDVGCIHPPTYCALQYNHVIFEYLDRKYGTGWREDIRVDVYGLQKGN